MRVFVTGFGPFGHVEENPSSLLAQGSGFPHAILEVSFEAVDRFLASEFARDDYDAVLMLGVSGRAKTMTLEQYGANACSTHLDVRGVRGPRIIDPEGPAWRRATLWEGEDFRRPGFAKSQSAGRYLCNYALYQGLRSLPDHRVGFLHVPSLDVLPIDEQKERLKRLLRALAER